MLYDADRMISLIRTWAADHCADFGEEESAALYIDFKQWIVKTRAMKHFPGPVAFGEAMRGAGYQKYRKNGLVRWVGIALKPKGGL